MKASELTAIYLSPHLDDAVYSCGGRIAHEISRGDHVEIWTIFAGDPTSELTPFARELHERWGAGIEAVAQRRTEDEAACARLGAGFRHMAYSDCIYRRYPGSGEPVIQVNEDLFRPVQPGEQGLLSQISDDLNELNPLRLPVVCPLGIGGHMDHRIVRTAAEATGFPLLYYADFPYAAAKDALVADLIPPQCEPQPDRLADDDIDRWVEGVAAYPSQLSSFWTSPDAMRASIFDYAHTPFGYTVWKCVAYRGDR